MSDLMIELEQLLIDGFTPLEASAMLRIPLSWAIAVDNELYGPIGN